MRAKYVACTICLFFVFGVRTSAQNVNFQIVPVGGTVINPGPSPTILVQPGLVLPFEVIARVIGDPNAPATVGLAGFEFNVLTDFGLAQTSPFTFSPPVSPLFRVNQVRGVSVADDIIGITGFQDLGAPGLITTGFALSQPEPLGTGQLLTPDFEGTFTVDLVGNADLFSITPGQPVTTTPGIVGRSPSFIIVTRFPESTTPVIPPDDGDDPVTPPDVVIPPIPGGPSGPAGPILPPGEQVEGDLPTGPPVTGVLAPGICGLGAASTLAFTLLGLGLLKQTRPRR
jgi:hypothetical protein